MASKNTTSESSVEATFVRICKRHGMHVMKMSTQFEQGVPDRMVLYKGHAGFAEIKAPGKKPRPVQEAYMRKLEKQGCFVGVVDDPNGVIGWIGNFFNHIEQKKNAQ